MVAMQISGRYLIDMIWTYSLAEEVESAAGLALHCNQCGS